MRTITIGVDLAKLVFSTCELDGNGRVVQRKELRREAFSTWLAQRPAGTVVAMEAGQTPLAETSHGAASGAPEDGKRMSKATNQSTPVRAR